MIQDSNNIMKTLKRLHIEYKELHTLIPYADNAKIHPIKQLEGIAESISKYGFLIPILVDINNVIVAGHARYEAAASLGINEIPCIMVDNLSPNQVDEFRILDNLLAESGHDVTKLHAEIARLNLDLKPFKLELKPLNVSLKEIDTNLNEPSNSINIITKGGDLWKLGEHQLIAGYIDLQQVDALIKKWQELTGKEACLDDGTTFNQLKKGESYGK